MSLGAAIRVVRQKSFYTQEDFANELNVSVSTVNRWEQNRVRPNVKTMREIKDFCHNHNLDFSLIEKVWLNIPEEN